MAEKKFAVIGSGMIGVGLGANAMLHGYKTAMFHRRTNDYVEARIKETMDILVKAEACTQEEADEAMKLAVYTNDLSEAVSGALLVEECMPERIDVKQDFYKRIQEVTGRDTIICSSTSGLFPTKLQEGMPYPETILVAHPYNPSYIIPLIELCGGEQTSEESIQTAKAFFEEIGKVPVICRKEVEGFLVNRLSWACMHEAENAVKDGLCSVEDIDKAITFGPGMRMAVTGQMLTISLGCEGGYIGLAKKYGKEPSPEDRLYAEGVDAAIANRKPEQGNTVEGVCEWRDHMLADILKLHGML